MGCNSAKPAKVGVQDAPYKLAEESKPNGKENIDPEKDENAKKSTSPEKKKSPRKGEDDNVKTRDERKDGKEGKNDDLSASDQDLMDSLGIMQQNGKFEMPEDAQKNLDGILDGENDENQKKKSSLSPAKSQKKKMSSLDINHEKKRPLSYNEYKKPDPELYKRKKKKRVNMIFS